MVAFISLLYRFCPASLLKSSGNSNPLKKNIIYPAKGLLTQGSYIKKRSAFKTVPVIVFALTFAVASSFFSNMAFAAKRVTAVAYGSQTGTANAGTGTSVTYTPHPVRDWAAESPAATMP